MSVIRFGTDGWRGVIADDFTYDNVALCAQGVAAYLKSEGLADRGLVLGYDTRFASEEFAARVAEVMAGNGIPVWLSTKPSPTPVISYNILDKKAGGGAIITASHNPSLWNGFKYKPDYAGSATPEITERLEAHIESAETTGVVSVPIVKARADGLVSDLDPAAPYMEHVGRMVDLEAIRGSGVKVAVDAMYGAGSGYLPELLADRGGLDLVQIHGERNPAFPGLERPEPIAPNLGQLVRLVQDSHADVGIAFDGDADRVGIVDEKGAFFTTHQTFAVIAHYLLDVKGERGALVKSLTSTRMIDRLGEMFQSPVFETPVGFKYVCPIMLRENALIGGEESGGYSVRGHIPERDGILSGLLVLEYMAKTGKRPSELLDRLYEAVGRLDFDRRDITYDPGKREAVLKALESAAPDSIAGVTVVGADDEDGKRFHLEDNAWVLVRFSGTEPLLRIYCEANSPELVQSILDEMQSMLGV